jgi:hypothetical protein
MSDPVTNVEIEDVLSSIRKLVADEKRTSLVAKKPSAAPGKLVLTPAQRITEVPELADDSAETVSSSNPILLTDPVISDVPFKHRSDERLIDEIPGTARLSEFGQVEGFFPDIDDVEAANAAEPESDTALNDDAPSEARLKLGRLIEEEVAAALADVKDGDWDQDASASAVRDHDGDEEWGELADDPSDMSDYSEDASEDNPFVDAVDTADDAEKLDAAPPNPLLTLEDKVAALGRLVARESNDFEEEREAPDEVALALTAEPMSWPDPAPFHEMAEPEDDAESNVLRSETAWPKPASKDDVDAEAETASEGPISGLSQEEATSAIELDDAMLREMVVEIVRSELQGALGERITRNVRKLVRREIHRMLISQEFE